MQVEVTLKAPAGAEQPVIVTVLTDVDEGDPKMAIVTATTWLTLPVAQKLNMTQRKVLVALTGRIGAALEAVRQLAPELRDRPPKQKAKR